MRAALSGPVDPTDAQAGVPLARLLQACHKPTEELQALIWSIYCPEGSFERVLTPFADPSFAESRLARDVTAASHPKFEWSPVSLENLQAMLAPEAHAQNHLFDLQKLDEAESELGGVLALLASFPPLRLVVGLAWLSEWLHLAVVLTEQSINSEGELTTGAVISTGSLLLAQLRELYQVAAEMFPSTPFRSEVDSWFVPGSLPRPAPLSPRASFLSETIAELQRRAGAVAFLRSLLANRHDQVTWLEKDNPFYQSPRLTQEKQLQSALHSYQSHLLAAWEEVCAGAQAERWKVPANWMLDELVLSLRAVEAIHTQKDESAHALECHLFGVGEARAQLASARHRLKEAYALPPTLEALVEALEAADPIEGELAKGNLAGLLARDISKTQVSSLLALWRKNQQLALDADSQATLVDSKLGFWERNLYGDGSKQELIRSAHGQAADCRIEVEHARGQIQRLLSQPLKAHPQAYLFYTLENLDQQLGQLRAVCGKRPGLDAAGHALIVNFCSVDGLQEAFSSARAHAKSFSAAYGQVPALYTWMLGFQL